MAPTKRASTGVVQTTAKTPRQIRQQWEMESVIASIPQQYVPDVRTVELEDGILEYNSGGTLEVVRGLRGKPVIREIDTKRILPGSGRLAPTNELAVADNRLKQSVSYRSALESLISRFGDDDAAKRTLEEVVDDFFDAANGSAQYVQCGHPGCDKKHAVAFKKDSNALFKMIELLVGKAPQQIEVKTTLEARIASVHEQRYVAKEIIYMPKDEWISRRQKMIEDGLIEENWLDGEYRELDDDEVTTE